jgi:hypothetical protein
MSRDMNINPKSAFVLLHKLRETMARSSMTATNWQAPVEVDGAYLRGRFLVRLDQMALRGMSSGGNEALSSDYLLG